MTDKYAVIKDELSSLGIEVLTEEMMRNHITFKIGGPASLFVRPGTREELINALRTVKKNGVRFFLLGNGSNVLFDDEGYDGVIVCTGKLNSVEIHGDTVTAECGALLSSVGYGARDKALTGFECLYGIPGTVGGAVFMNAGAYGGEIKDILVSTDYYDMDNDRVVTISNEKHGFGYRESVFKHNGGIILSSTLKLKSGDKDEISAAMEDYRERRVSKQPLEYPSAGSTFKRYPGRYTGQMIEELGMKGLRVGGAEVSEKHAGFIINKDCATSADVLSLIELVKSNIKKAYGIEIECEIICVK